MHKIDQRWNDFLSVPGKKLLGIFHVTSSKFIGEILHFVFDDGTACELNTFQSYELIPKKNNYSNTTLEEYLQRAKNNKKGTTTTYSVYNTVTNEVNVGVIEGEED